MTLEREHSRGADALAAAGEIMAACRAARELEDAGLYREAAGVLADYWAGPGHEPRHVIGVAERAHLYLRAGSLTGWLGKVHGVAGYQERAKDLLGSAAALFAEAGDFEGAAEATVAMSVAYWREGAYREALALLDSVIENRDAGGRLVRLNALLAKAMVERSAGRYNDAAEVLRAVEPLLTPDDSPRTHCAFHNGRASTYHHLALATGLGDMLERAEHEYVATSYYAELVDNKYYLGVVENNLGLVYLRQGKFGAAHDHAEKSIGLFEEAGNGRAAATPYDTRARVFIAEGNYPAAEQYAEEAVRRLVEGDESALLAEALVTRGVARARIGLATHARADLLMAAEVASHVGDVAGAGRAHLALLEELLPQLSVAEAQAVYDEADRKLAGVQDASVTSRLRAAASAVLRAVRGQAAADSYSWDGFSLDIAVRDFKGKWIERAMRDANGIVSRAARLLGLAAHQTLFEMLKNDYPELRNSLQTRHRRRSLVGKGKRGRGRAKRVTRVAAAPAACRKATHQFFLRLALPEGDGALSQLGPRGGDTLVAYSGGKPEAGGLVVARAGGRSQYGYYWPCPNGFRLTRDAAGMEPLEWAPRGQDAEVYGQVVGYIRGGSRVITPFRKG